jgi:hypothetical protein
MMGVGSHNGSVLSLFGEELSKINTESHFWQNFPLKQSSQISSFFINFFLANTQGKYRLVL